LLLDANTLNDVIHASIMKIAMMSLTQVGKLWPNVSP